MCDGEKKRMKKLNWELIYAVVHSDVQDAAKSKGLNSKNSCGCSKHNPHNANFPWGTPFERTLPSEHKVPRIRVPQRTDDIVLGLISQSNWSMVFLKGKENKGPKSLNNILLPEKPMFLFMWKEEKVCPMQQRLQSGNMLWVQFAELHFAKCLVQFNFIDLLN